VEGDRHGDRRREQPMSGGDTFPRQYARTQRFTLGEPRDLVISPDGARVVFARSRGGSDPVNCLWVVDAATGGERLVADPNLLLGSSEDDLPPEERARRERAREAAGGVTAFATDLDVTVAAFALSGRLFVADLVAATARELPVDGPVFDPRPDPTGSRVAFVAGRRLGCVALDGAAGWVASEPGDPPDITWGSADFVAAEEMDRLRGYWWSPAGDVVAVCRVDVGDVPVWHISNPADPGTPPAAVRYPAAGTTNPDVRLFLCPVGDAAEERPERRVEVAWDRRRHPYLAKVNWTEHGLAITVQSRDQRSLEVLGVDPADGSTTAIFHDHDEAWVELVPGSGVLIAPDVLVMAADRDGARRLIVGDDVVSPPDVQLRSIITASERSVVVTANPIDDATVQHVYRWSSADGFEPLTDGLGVHTAAANGDTVMVRSATLDEPGARWRLPDGTQLDRCAEVPLVKPNVSIARRGADASRDAVLLPADHDGSPLPVLLDPYGGPHAQRVTRNHAMFLTSQWFADQGFAVVVADGRGTPGRGSSYERAVLHDLATGVLDDQVAALHAAAERHPELDVGRVAIRGWSFGGYLAALAVLRRPDVFHAAIASAPVTEWRLYDTHYTERYLGDPNTHPEVYDANSLLPLAAELTRPLLLVHGLADDNVVAAHSLQLSAALLAAGRPHELLALVGVTHMTPQEVVAENLLLHQLDFLRRALALATVSGR
jgi:dipeptidyl-peptidase-4